MNNTPLSTEQYSLSLARKILVTAVVFVFVGAVFLKSNMFCSKAVAFCTENITPSSDTQIAPGYYHYSAEKLSESLENKKTVVLYFHAPWCTTCSSFDEELRKQKDALPENTVILQIPYDTSSDLKKKYGVLYQHTLVLLDKTGNVQEMWIGGDLKSLLEYLKKNS